MPSSRLFAAVALTARARREVDEQRTRLLAGLDETTTSALRLVREDQLHVTLVFIGQTDGDRVSDFITSLRRPFIESPFGISFGGMGVFPPRGTPSVLWMGVADGGEALVDLQRAVATRFGTLGVAEEKRPFRPHITLGRWKRGEAKPAPRFTGDRGLRVGAMQVTHVTLFESRVSSAGSAYTALAEAPLVDSKGMH